MSSVRCPINCNIFPILLLLEIYASFFLKKVKTIMMPEMPDSRNESNLNSLLDK